VVGGGDQGYSAVAGGKKGLDGIASNGGSNTGFVSSKFLSGGTGTTVSRGGQIGYGGYGSGAAQDDGIGYAGGYTLGTSSSGAYSYTALPTLVRMNGERVGPGQVIITFM